MDDEAAEIELLEQNLNKTRQISQKMTAILSSFDNRLVKLEKAILPLYASTQLLTRRASNIDSVLGKIEEVASNRDGIATEEALILRGPQPGQLETYKEALERLNAGIAFKSSEEDTSQAARIVETGAAKVTQLYTKLVAESSAGSPPGDPEFTFTPFDPSLRVQLAPIVAFLRTLPLPATHPNHPAALAIQSTLRDAQRGYGEMRGNWSRKCLESHAKRILDRSENVDGVLAGREIGAWAQNMLTVAKEEYNLLSDLAPIPTSSLVATTFSSLITPLISLFKSTLSSLNTSLKRNLQKHIFLALSTYTSLSESESHWEDLMCRRAGRRENELKDALSSLRSVCLRSFPELIANIKAGAVGKGGEPNTNVADFVTSTVEFLERVPEVKTAVGSALLKLGDGNWKMGEGITVPKTARLGEGDEDLILENFIFDVVSTTVASLVTLSRSQRRPAFGSIFLLNNISYLRTHLLIQPINGVDALLSSQGRELLNSNFRTAKANYMDANLSPLLTALAEDKDKSKSSVKEKFMRFFDLLDELVERHTTAVVLPGDLEADERETVCQEVALLVVPLFQRFVQKNPGKDFSRNPQKYIKLSATEVEARLKSIYS
ncbi:hypothetical protein BDM02DRAFT_3266446 [Thelephora ganbajun]|uniref:Uncharacterized protein n=1 Tax=Thelephora ganbajun TaxID=370292 RepID=A0ACB6ZRU9_THEGA|nr:hypothetical protein BDM02DRAFT_3266446 [Thelephora ganbajun]